MLPLNALFIRHGEAEHNVANKMSRDGDNKYFTPEFLSRHSTSMRLSNLGRRQSAVTGLWLKRNKLDRFDRYVVSEYTRTLETAGWLDLPNARWHVDFQLRERDHGDMDIIPEDVRKRDYAKYIEQRKKHLMYAPMPNGESIAELCNRVQINIIDKLECESAENVIFVSHGDVMRAVRVILEHIPADDFHEIDRENPPWFRVGNCQVLHYTRVDPTDPQHVRDRFGWVRSINPFDPDYAGHDWKEIVCRTYSNQDLLELAERYTRSVADE